MAVAVGNSEGRRRIAGNRSIAHNSGFSSCLGHKLLWRSAWCAQDAQCRRSLDVEAMKWLVVGYLKVRQCESFSEVLKPEALPLASSNSWQAWHGKELFTASVGQQVVINHVDR